MYLIFYILNTTIAFIQKTRNLQTLNYFITSDQFPNDISIFLTKYLTSICNGIESSLGLFLPVDSS